MWNDSHLNTTNKRGGEADNTRSFELTLIIVDDASASSCRVPRGLVQVRTSRAIAPWLGRMVGEVRYEWGKEKK